MYNGGLSVFVNNCSLSFMGLWVGWFVVAAIVQISVSISPSVLMFSESMSVDALGWALVMMTSILTFGCMLVLFLGYSTSSYLSLSLVVMALASLMTFITCDMLEFYLAFELTLIPILMMILGWGYQPERFVAGSALLLYTLAGSLPLLLLVGLYDQSILMSSFGFYQEVSGVSSKSSMISTLTMVAFLVKLPMFILHSWLPKAHVEAPVYGSMFLAGTLLKLGGVGLFRFGDLHSVSVWAIPFSVALVSLVVVGGACLVSVDMKVLIALSSVAHMGLALSLLAFNSNLAAWGSLLIFLTHGFSSSYMFLMAHLLYTRTNSRSLVLNQSVLIHAPSLNLLLFLSCLALMGGPPASTLLSELVGLSTVTGSWVTSIWVLVPGTFLGGAYSMGLYARLAHGASLSSLSSMVPATSSELLVSSYHFLWVVLYVALFSWLLI